MNCAQRFISAVVLLSGFLGVPLLSFSQPIGQVIQIVNNTPTYETAKLIPITPGGPVILSKSPDEDREPKAAILNDDTTVVFWVNRAGSHHVNGVDRTGTRLLPVVDQLDAADAIIGNHTGGNTNWTLCKPDRLGGGFLAAATYLADSGLGDATIPLSVTDEYGVREDSDQGHGFFKLFDRQLEPITKEPVSISQFSAGHLEWDGCWLNDGKFVIGVVAYNHPYAGDIDFPTGGIKVATLNLFNPDGTRFKDEFFISDTVGSQGNIHLGALADGFVCLYQDDQTTVGGPNLVKGIIYDNQGNVKKEFIASDTVNGIGVDWMDAGGGNTFVTVHQVNVGSDSNLAAGLPSEMLGMPILLAQLWNSQGERVGPYIVVSQHSDLRGVSRPRCAMARNGSFAVSWHDAAADNVQYVETVVGRIFNFDGTPTSDAFIVHSLPEFPDTLGGNAAEGFPGINNNLVAFTWSSRAVPDGGARDIVAMVFKNPAQGTGLQDWFIYDLNP